MPSAPADDSAGHAGGDLAATESPSTSGSANHLIPEEFYDVVENRMPRRRLKVAEAQEDFVADNATSIAQAHFCTEAWFRAIYAGEQPVGFVMLSDKPEKPEYYLWRFMIGADHQGKGYGRRAIELLIEHVRTRPRAEVLFTSVVEAEGGPRLFYEKLGFVSTGRHEEGELVLRYELA